MVDETKTERSKASTSDRAEKLGKVKALIELGVSVTTACRKVGYPRSSFYVDTKSKKAQEPRTLPEPSTSSAETTTADVPVTGIVAQSPHDHAA